MKKEVCLSELYIEISQEIAKYCQINKEQRGLMMLQEQEYFERKKQLIIAHIKEILFKIKSKLTQDSTESSPYKLPKTYTTQKDGLKDIFKWLNPSYSYLIFLQNIKKNNPRIFTSQYEEIEVKRKVIKYFKEYTHWRKTDCTALSIRRYTDIENKSYCIQCRRVIVNKMTARHNSSKIHARTTAVYLRVVEAQAMQISSQFTRIVRRNKMHLRHLIQRQLKVKPKKITLDPYPEKEPEKDKEPQKNIQYKCTICNKTYLKESLFMRHFEQRDHIIKLKLLGIKNIKDYIGLTTEEAVRTRRELYFTPTA